jgi:hypothetical protein
VVLPPDLLNSDLVTLDGINVSQISASLRTPVVPGDHDLQHTLKGIEAALAQN